MYATYIYAEYYESIIAETYLLYGENIFSLGVHYTTSAFNGINSTVSLFSQIARQDGKSVLI